MLKQFDLEPESLKRPDAESDYLWVSPAVSLSELETLIRGRPNNEVAGVFGSDGRLFFAPKIGGHEEVHFTEIEVAMIPQGATITHSHPENYPLSLSDFLTAGALDLAEIRAVGPSKVFSAKQPKKGWPIEQKLRNAYSRVMKLTNDEMRQALQRNRGKLPEPERRSLWLLSYTKLLRRELTQIGVKQEETDVIAK